MTFFTWVGFILIKTFSLLSPLPSELLKRFSLIWYSNCSQHSQKVCRVFLLDLNYLNYWELLLVTATKDRFDNFWKLRVINNFRGTQESNFFSFWKKLVNMISLFSKFLYFFISCNLSSSKVHTVGLILKDSCHFTHERCCFTML